VGAKSEGKKVVRIWDPMCGSGTFGLVAMTMLEGLPVRSEVKKLFEWVHWPVYKNQYLEDYWKQKEE
jgi:23S rRNA G2445 N2-methylase RlmL